MDSSERSGTSTWTKVTEDNIEEFMQDMNRKMKELELRNSSRVLNNSENIAAANKKCNNLLDKDSSKGSQNAPDSLPAQLENNNSSKNSLECSSSSGKLLSIGSHSPGQSKSLPKPDPPNYVPTVPWLMPNKCPLSREELNRIAKSLPRPIITDDSDSSDDEDYYQAIEEEENDNEDGISSQSETAECSDGHAQKDDAPAPEATIHVHEVPVPVPVKVLSIKGPSCLKENMQQRKQPLPQHQRKFTVQGIARHVGTPCVPKALHRGNVQDEQKRLLPPMPSVRGAKVAKPSSVQPSKFSNPVARTKPSEQITVKGKCYNIMQCLGSGGSSTVHLVCDPTSKHLFAIKCVDLTKADEETCQGYLNEIKLLQKLQGSDRIVKMHDFEHKENEKFLFVVMEHGDTDLASYVNGILRRGERLSHEMIRFYWSEMLKAVQVIHNAGIIHSDLKPANFLLVKGCLKLIDFGIASAIQPDVTSVVRINVAGTFNYISPEALRSTKQDGPGIKIGVKADVWSLGCILYSWVYGKTPFQHIITQMEKYQAILSDTHIISFPDLPDKQLLDVLKKCLVRDRKERASTQELLQHPFLTSTSSVAPEEIRNPKNLLAHISNSLQLTPRRQQKLDEIRFTRDGSSTDVLHIASLPEKF